MSSTVIAPPTDVPWGATPDAPSDAPSLPNNRLHALSVTRPGKAGDRGTLIGFKSGTGLALSGIMGHEALRHEHCTRVLRPREQCLVKSREK